MADNADLKIVYPIGTRLLLGALWLATLTFAALLLRASAPLPIVAGAWAVAAVVGWIFRLTMLTVCEIDTHGISNRTWRGKRSFLRADLLGCEEIGGDPKSVPSVLIRFKTGVAVLSADRGCRNPGEVLEYLTRTWNLHLADLQRHPAGPVEPQLELKYENFHRWLLGAGAALLALIAVASPLLWVCLIVAGYCARACYYCCCWIETTGQGVTLNRPWLAPVMIAWGEIGTVRYWHSAIQGGVVISSREAEIRVYRWIANYPKFNRLLRDRAKRTCFDSARRLPVKISMNRRRRTLLLPLAVLGGAAVVFAVNGSWEAVVAATLLPGLAILAMVVGLGRTIEIDAETARDTYRVLWHKSVAVYKRSELVDMRLGRQLSAGGLWIRFGQTRLEITNADAEFPPEEILACLLEQWQCQTKVERERAWVLEGVA